MRIAFLNYNILPDYHSPEEWIQKIAPSVGIMEALAKKTEVHYFIRIGYTGTRLINAVQYHCLKTKTGGSAFPFSLHHAVKKVKPDIVLVFGLHFSFQIIQLKQFLPTATKIIAEHHADNPFGRIKRVVQKIADHCIDSYHFTTIENAEPWLKAKIIVDKQKCKTLGLASTRFVKQNKMLSKQITGMTSATNFLFVGRLNENKDPFTILKAFERYLFQNTDCALHLIYQTDELLPQVQSFINRSELLKKNVYLHGKKEYAALEIWYSAADYLISASLKESAGFSVIEAMACGCIPIVSNIPASLKSIDNGKYGFISETGNAMSLYKTILFATALDRNAFSLQAEAYFKKQFSFEKISADFYDLATKLIAE